MSTTTMHAANRPALAPAARFALLPLCLTVALHAQDALRGWGYESFASDAFDVPATWLVAASQGLVGLRSDDVVQVVGQVSLVEAPPPAAGAHYVEFGVGSTYGGAFGIALDSNGQLTPWGNVPPSMQPPTLPAGTSYAAIAVYGEHAIARLSNGAAIAWGDGTQGQTTLPTLPAGVTVTKVAAGYRTTLQLRSDGTLLAAGNGALAAVPTLPTGVTYTDFWAGNTHAFAARSDGVFVGWGNDQDGRLRLPPPRGSITYEQIACGSAHTIALRSDGTLVAVGATWQGAGALPPLPPGRSITQLVAGYYFSAARLDDGSVIASPGLRRLHLQSPPAGEQWADVSAWTSPIALSSSGQLVDPFGAFSFYNDPPPLPPGMYYTDVAAGWGHCVALRSDGRAVAWGWNAQGQCNLPPLPPGTTWLAAGTTGTTSMLIRSDGALAMVGSYNPPSYLWPPAGTSYVQVEGDEQSIVRLRSDGVVEVSTGYLDAQTPSLPPGRRYVDVTVGIGRVAALRNDGVALVWGGSIQPTLPQLPFGVVHVDVDASGGCLVVRRSDGLIDFLPSSNNLPAPPTPRAGESFVQARATNNGGVVRVGPTRTYVGFASGCAGTLPTSRIVPRDTPFVGGTFTATVFEAPQGLALVAFGNQTTPQSLAAIGMPGCDLHVTLDQTLLIAGADQQAQFAVQIPNSLALLGATFANQAFVLDPAANAAGFVASDAAAGVIGRR